MKEIFGEMLRRKELEKDVQDSSNDVSRAQDHKKGNLYVMAILSDSTNNFQENSLRKYLETCCPVPNPKLSFNPFTLRAAKRGLTILKIFPFQNHFFENI